MVRRIPNQLSVPQVNSSPPNLTPQELVQNISPQSLNIIEPKSHGENYLMKLLTVSHPKLDIDIPQLEEELNVAYSLYKELQHTSSKEKNTSLIDFLLCRSSANHAGTWDSEGTVQVGSWPESWGNNISPGRPGLGQTHGQLGIHGLYAATSVHGLNAEASVGDAQLRASRLASIQNGGVGVDFGVRARANAADTAVSFEHENGLTGQNYAAQAGVGATTRARVETDIGSHGLKLALKTNAFAGTQIGASAGADALGFGETYYGQEWNGVGVKLDPSISLNDGKLQVNLGFGAALGAGGYEGAAYSVDFVQIAKELDGLIHDPASIWPLIRSAAASYGGVDDLEQTHQMLIKEFQQDAELAEKVGNHQLAQQMRAEVNYLQHDPDYQAQKTAATVKGATGLIQTPTRLRQFQALNRLVYRRAAAAAQWASDKSGLSDSRFAAKISDINQAGKAKFSKMADSMSTAVKESKVGKAVSSASKSVSESLDAVRSSDAVTSLVARATAVSEAVSRFAEPFSKGVQSAMVALRGADGAAAAGLRAALGVSEASTIEIPVVGEAVVAAVTVIGAAASGVVSEMDDKQKLNAAHQRCSYDTQMIQTLGTSSATLNHLMLECESSLKTHPNDQQLLGALSKLKLTSAELSKAVTNLQNDLATQNSAIDKLHEAMTTDWFFDSGTAAQAANQDLKGVSDEASKNLSSANVAKKALGGVEYVAAKAGAIADTAGRVLKNIFVPCN